VLLSGRKEPETQHLDINQITDLKTGIFMPVPILNLGLIDTLVKLSQ